MIIGLGHQMQVGKDTAAQALVRDLGFIRIGWADKLKDLLARIDPLVMPGGGSMTVNTSAGRGRVKYMVTSMGWERAKQDWPEVRRLLQELGLGARETFGEDCWIEALKRDLTPGLHYVIPDTRFPNEAEAIKALGGKLIKITRPDVRGAHMGHASELALVDYDGWDAVVENVGSVVELERKVVELVRGWMIKEALPGADPAA